jgi:hypothetical protein
MSLALEEARRFVYKEGRKTGKEKKERNTRSRRSPRKQ